MLGGAVGHLHALYTLEKAHSRIRRVDYTFDRILRNKAVEFLPLDHRRWFLLYYSFLNGHWLAAKRHLAMPALMMA